MNIRNGHIIHIFALLHVAAAIGCRMAGIQDEIWLTLITVVMVSLLCIRLRAKIEITVSSIILTNVTAYILGVYGAKLIALLSDSSLLTHSLSTFLTTEIVGWGTVLLLKATVGKKEPGPAAGGRARAGKIRKEHILLLAAIIALILTFRLLILELFSSGTGSDLLSVISLLFSRSWLTVVMLCCLILLVRLIRVHGWSNAVKSAVVVGSCLMMAGFAVLYIRVDPLSGRTSEITAIEMTQIFIVAATLALIGFTFVYIVYYALGLRAAMAEERNKAALAEFQYARLKLQVNPHFLFNSLNILDCLVLDGQTSQASLYIHKLAGIYRYMLRYDDRTTVPLADEMEFVGMYTDLLKVRFEDGFTVNTDIPEKDMPLHVIPCSVQMLIENAIKHNRIGKDSPLEINIEAESLRLRVSNPIKPKVHTGESTRIGLNYLKRQYHDRYGKEVSVTTDNGIFTVSVPLLSPQADGENASRKTIRI